MPHDTERTGQDGPSGRWLCAAAQTPSSPAPPSSSAEASSLGPTAPLPHPVPLHLSKPAIFSGDSGDCTAFLTQCELHFELQVAAFPSERAKVAYIISHLTGRAEAWATAEWSRKTAICNSVARFTKSFTQIFQLTTPGREAARALVRLRQGGRRGSDYAVGFRTLTAESSWNPEALFDTFIEGLSEPLKDQLTPLDLPDGLDALIALAIKIDKCLFERELGRSRSACSPPCQQGRQYSGGRSPSSSWHHSSPPRSGTTPTEEPMQLGRTRLSLEERQRRMVEGRCLYCGLSGHYIATCPRRGSAPPSKVKVLTSSTLYSVFSILLSYQSQSP